MAEVVRGLSRQTWLLLGVLGICVLVAAWDFLLTPQGAPPASKAKDVQGLSAAILFSGVVGGLIVWGFTVVSGWVIRTRQRGRELRGLARVIRPEMERNASGLAYLQQVGVRGPGALSLADYHREHPIYDAWRDTRTRLAELMPEEDFAVLANFYEALDLLKHIAEREEHKGWDDASDAAVRIQLKEAEKGSIDAMRIVDGYCESQWKPLVGWSPGPID